MQLAESHKLPVRRQVYQGKPASGLGLSGQREAFWGREESGQGTIGTQVAPFHSPFPESLH